MYHPLSFELNDFGLCLYMAMKVLFTEFADIFFLSQLSSKINMKYTCCRVITWLFFVTIAKREIITKAEVEY